MSDNEIANAEPVNSKSAANDEQPQDASAATGEQSLRNILRAREEVRRAAHPREDFKKSESDEWMAILRSVAVFGIVAVVGSIAVYVAFTIDWLNYAARVGSGADAYVRCYDEVKRHGDFSETGDVVAQSRERTGDVWIVELRFWMIAPDNSPYTSRTVRCVVGDDVKILRTSFETPDLSRRIDASRCHGKISATDPASCR